MRNLGPLLSLVLLAALSARTPAFGEGARSVAERLGHAADARLLMIHADDLGMARSVDKASFGALEQGFVDSASIMVPCPWLPDVSAFAREHPDADLGLHLVLNSEWTTYRWGPVSSRDTVPSLLDEEGYFPLVETTVIAKARPAEVERELEAQIERALAFGIRPTHLDSHMGTLFGTPELVSVYHRLARKHGLPFFYEARGQHNPEEQVPADEVLVDRLVGIEPGVPPGEWRPAYEKLLSPLPPGVYELVVHLAYDDVEMRGATAGHPDWGAAWRQSDVDLVSSPEFRHFLDEQGFVRVTWRELARALPPDYASRR
jgi:predicted glycoside hydrolase/deacetylase ChbG (UPF0249 family)